MKFSKSTPFSRVNVVFDLLPREALLWQFPAAAFILSDSASPILSKAASSSDFFWTGDPVFFAGENFCSAGGLSD
ncbi:MAG TPA: hypothetical protein VGH42_06585 [Verrucomicrobiae bacterium]